MSEPKQQLAELIEAYAVAKATGNNLLTKLSVAQLSQFLDGCTIAIENSVTEQEDGGQE